MTTYNTVGHKALVCGFYGSRDLAAGVRGTADSAKDAAGSLTDFINCAEETPENPMIKDGTDSEAGAATVAAPLETGSAPKKSEKTPPEDQPAQTSPVKISLLEQPKLVDHIG